MSLIAEVRIIPRKRLSDERGWFLKVIDGSEEGIPSHTGEVYLTMAVPGQARGNHYHPLTAEWFTLIEGKALLRVMDPQSGERAEWQLDADAPQTIHVPAGLAHVFINPVDGPGPFLLLAYSANPYDPDDTIPFAVTP